MKSKDLFLWFHERVQNYNLFIPDEDDYGDENDELEDSATTVKHQKYATRLYIPLLIRK
jgi:hypothetical protein